MYCIGSLTPHCFLLLVIGVQDAQTVRPGLLIRRNANKWRHLQTHLSQWPFDLDMPVWLYVHNASALLLRRRLKDAEGDFWRH